MGWGNTHTQKSKKWNIKHLIRKIKTKRVNALRNKPLLENGNHIHEPKQDHLRFGMWRK